MVDIIVEDGSIVPGANSYISVSELNTFAANRGITLTGSPDILLIQAMDYIESLTYKGRKKSQDQPLQWPRVGVIIDGYLVPSNEIPKQLIDAQAQTAISIDQGVDPLQDVSQKVIRKRVGDLEIQYSEGSSSTTISRKISSYLWKLLGSSNSANIIEVDRG